MKFTVLGGSGFIGRHLVRHLTAQGIEVHAPRRGDWPEARDHLGHVIYAVGLTADFRSRPFETLHAHSTLVSDLLENASFTSFTYLSSTRVYSRSESTSEDASLCVAPMNPDDLYNISKLAGEAICLARPLAGVRAVRLSNVVGPGISETETFVGAICREARAGCIRLQSAASTEKDYVWIGDVVSILPEIAQSGQHRLYNIAGGRQISHAEWASALSDLTGCDVQANAEAVDMSFPPIDIERLRDEFGFRPQRVLERVREIAE